MTAWIHRRSTSGAYCALLKELSNEDQNVSTSVFQSFSILDLFGNCVRHVSFTEMFTNINTCHDPTPWIFIGLMSLSH